MRREKLKKKIRNNTRGITLIALVITIIVLLILAGVSIGLVFDSDGLFGKANTAATKWNQAKNDEVDYLSTVMNDLDKYNGIYGGGSTQFGEPETTKKKAPDGEWWIPKGFEESEESPEKIKDGKIIKDKEGNEWVWVPCYLDDNGTKKGQQQYSQATEYTRTAFTGEDITSDYTEALDDNDSASIKKYGGYYIGRYEAGANREVTSPPAEGYSKTTLDPTRKVLIQENKYPYNWITIADCISKSNSFANDNKYDTNKVYTKLVSSYAWDTAICFIDKTVSNYSTNSEAYGNYSDHKFSDDQGLLNTGLTTPVCNIYDMGGNLWEYTSEAYEYNPYVHRGGIYDHSSSDFPAGHRGGHDGYAYSFDTFRVTLYLE